MKIISKAISSILLITLLLSTNGCLTYSTVQKAEGSPGRFPADDPRSQPHGGYYALLPLTVPVDVATSPIQGILLLVFYAQGGLKPGG
jgi:hypothetical protein